jgi:glycosyltransferase involved in cell wall biosynthesis
MEKKTLDRTIAFWLTHPFSVDSGGSYQITKALYGALSKMCHVKEFSHMDEEVNFDTLLLFDFTYFDEETIAQIKHQGVKVVVLPIYDRMISKWRAQLLSRLYFPVHHEYAIRKRILKLADHILVHNQTEWHDMKDIYEVPEKKMKLFHYGLADDFFETSRSVGPELFYDRYGWKDFVFCPAAAINKRKNQINLLKAIQGTDIKLVLNNTHNIQDGLNEEFHSLTKSNPHVLLLEKLSFEELISAYQNASVSISVSLAETAGLVNLEAAYNGCKVVASDLGAFREYMDNRAIFVNPKDQQSILNGIKQALEESYDSGVKSFIEHTYSWDSYAADLLALT